MVKLPVFDVIKVEAEYIAGIHYVRILHKEESPVYYLYDDVTKDLVQSKDYYLINGASENIFHSVLQYRNSYDAMKTSVDMVEMLKEFIRLKNEYAALQKPEGI